MIETRALKLNRLVCALAAFALAATPAFAVNKDMVQLQTEVSDLQQAVAHLQQSNDERMGVLKDLVQQTADSVNKMSVTVEGLQQQMHGKGAAGRPGPAAVHQRHAAKPHAAREFCPHNQP